jgi:hypothetical protein
MMNFGANFLQNEATKTSSPTLNRAEEFSDYSFFLNAIVAAQGPPMDGILDGTLVRPLPIPPHDNGAGVIDNLDEIAARVLEINTWNLARNRLYYLIIMALGPDVKPLIRNIPTGEARLVWLRISSHFQGSSISDTAGNVTKLIGQRMTGSLATFIDSIRHSGHLLSANIAALTERNRAAVIAGTHEEIIQVAVRMLHASNYLQPCVENLWNNPNLTFEAACDGLTVFDLRWKRDKLAKAGARVAEALVAGDDPSLPLSITLSSAPGKVVKVVTGTDNRSGEKVSLLCAHCHAGNHGIETYWILHPEMKVTHNAHRKALTTTATKKIGRVSGPSSAQMAQQDWMFYADFQPPDLGGFENFGGFGKFNTEVTSEESAIQATASTAASRDVPVSLTEGESPSRPWWTRVPPSTSHSKWS